jgi:hypothetical protein
METMPKSLSLEEVRQFHLARLALFAAKTDYWCWLYDLNDRVWRSSVEAYGGTKLPLDARAWGRRPYLDVERAWDEGDLVVPYEFQGKGKFKFGLDFWPRGWPLTLWSAAIDDKGEANGLAEGLGHPWEQDRTQKGWWRVEVDPQASIDDGKLKRASQLANQALSVLVSRKAG